MILRDGDNRLASWIDYMTETDDLGGAASELAGVLAGHAPEMLRQARRAVRSEADAEDAVQEVFLAVLRAPHVLGAVERLGAWLLTLVRRRCVDIVREERRRTGLHERAASARAEAQGDGVLDAADDLCREVARAVEELPRELRTPLVANVLEEKTFRQIASETGISMGTLMARKARAVALVREELRRKGLVD